MPQRPVQLRGSDLDHHTAFALGAPYAQLGDADESLEWLERASDTGFPCYPWFEKDPLLDAVRGTPGFARLLERIERHIPTPAGGGVDDRVAVLRPNPTMSRPIANWAGGTPSSSPPAVSSKVGPPGRRNG